MKIIMTQASAFALCVVITMMLVFSAGCIKTTQNFLDGNTQSHVLPEPGSAEPVVTVDTPLPGSAANTTPMIMTIVPTPTFVMEEIDSAPYFTPDPYKLPYRNLTNESSTYPYRKTGTLQSAKHIVLGSNTSAFLINVPEGPLVLDLTFIPQFDSPDQTGDTGSSYPGEEGTTSDDEGDSDDSSGENGRILSGAYSFVYPYAEITVIDTVTNGTVAMDGYGRTYSSEKTKTIPVYRDGTYIVTVTGDFIAVDMKIITGPAVVPEITPGPVSVSPVLPEEEW